MAKKNNAARVTDDTLVDGDMPVSETTGKTATPEGFEDVSSDIEAVYDYRHEKSVFVRLYRHTFCKLVYLLRQFLCLFAHIFP